MAAASHRHNSCFIFPPKEDFAFTSQLPWWLWKWEEGWRKGFKADIREGQYKQSWKEKGEGGRKMKGGGVGKLRNRRCETLFVLYLHSPYAHVILGLWLQSLGYQGVNKLFWSYYSRKYNKRNAGNTLIKCGSVPWSLHTIPLSLRTWAFCFMFEICGHGSCGPDSSTCNYSSTAVIRALH